MRQYFDGLHPAQPTPEHLVNVNAYLEVEPTQEGAEHGLVFSVGIENGGADELQLLNPFDLLQTQLLNERGAPVALPARAPNVLVHSAGSNWKLKSALPILAVRRNERTLSADVLDVPTITLSASEEFAVTFAIDRLVGQDGGQRLASGSFSIRCLLTLIYAADTEESRNLSVGPVRVDYRQG